MKLPDALSALPVCRILPDLDTALASSGRAVLQAPPGAGKTTAVPLALLDQTWLGSRKILMLEPRRLAARACARYMANLLGEKTGETVGYRVRMDTRVGPLTRIEVITEGILTRMIQSDPGLEAAGLVIFDEFHERSIHSDTGLVLCLDAAGALREDLRILVMSATMDVRALSHLLGNAPVIRSRGKTWPVETVYMPPKTNGPGAPGWGADRFGPVLKGCVAAVARALSDHDGDILVFLPGQGEIRRMAGLLDGIAAPGIQVLPLFGNLDLASQDKAISPSGPGERKIVLATAIAETSLTIDGIGVVVDSGLMRQSIFSPGLGFSRLKTLPVSKASADQRRGRAGRTGPGVCYRIWSEHVNKGLVPYHRPEILSCDLAPLVLELALWGVTNPFDLKWPDPPLADPFEAARDLLKRLGALDSRGRILGHGRDMAQAGIHPRLAHMILEGDRAGDGALACLLAALLGERDFLVFRGQAADPDVRLRLEVLAALRRHRPVGKGLRPKAHLARTILKSADRLQQRFNVKAGRLNFERAGRTLALAFPERVGKQRTDLSYVLASGRGACFKTPNTVSAHAYVVAAHLDGGGRDAAIFLAAPIHETELTDLPGQAMKTENRVAWDAEKQTVRAVAQTCYMRLLIKEKVLPGPDPHGVTQAVIQGIRQMGLDCLSWTGAQKLLCRRVGFLREKAGVFGLPDLSSACLLDTLETWLGPFLDGVRSARDLKQLDLSPALSVLLPWDLRQRVDALAPTHVKVPSGSNRPLEYADGGMLRDAPVLAVRLQEMFGQTRTPCVAGGRIAVTLHLLSPANRPVQVTRDLESFWRNTYKAVKKDLMGRYPKHYWPDDPLTAVPTSRAKPRKQK